MSFRLRKCAHGIHVFPISFASQRPNRGERGGLTEFLGEMAAARPLKLGFAVGCGACM